MKEGKSSLTAEMVTFVRAIESIRPAEERIFYDPLAEDLLDPWIKPFFWSKKLAGLASNFMINGPWYVMYSTLSSRTRYIDDCLERGFDGGIKQLVILGAGFDARPYRFDELKDGIKVFEVDFPATQQAKIKRVTEALGYAPRHVNYVPIDFLRDDLRPTLLESGYDPGVKTLFIWEGVTMYLTPEAVDETLAFVSDNSPAGSSIVFTFSQIPKRFGIIMQASMKMSRISFGISREPVLFAIKEGTLDNFLKSRGFELREELPGSTLAERYFQIRTGFWKYGLDISAIAHATVAP